MATEANANLWTTDVQVATQELVNKPKHIKLIKWGYAFIFMIIIIVVLMSFVMPKIDLKNYTEYLERTTLDTMNQDIMSLMNANALSNLPNVNIITNNQEINDFARCRNGFVYLGPYDPQNTTDYRIPCFNTCGDTGQVVIVRTGDEVLINSNHLREGIWCVSMPTGQDCNLDINYLHLGINRLVCRTKYPNLFGNANNVVACQNELFPVTNSDLIDYTTGRPINLINLRMTNENERLPSDPNVYRFGCRFGEDFMGNAYLPHPLNRFHPIRNPCNYSIFRSHLSVKPIIDEANQDWHCDCGDFNVTRVKQVDPADPKSTCSTCIHEIKPLDPIDIGSSGPQPYTETYTLSLPYLCFTLFSQYTDVLNMLPCTQDQFVVSGNRCNTLEMRIAHHEDAQVPLPFSALTTIDMVEVLEGFSINQKFPNCTGNGC